MTPLRLCYVGPAASANLRRWAGWFAARGHEVTVITVEPTEEGWPGARQVDVRAGLPPGKLGRLRSALRMVAWVRRLRPDVVHGHYLRGLAWGLPLCRRHPFVVSPWGSDILAEQGAFREWYSRGLTRRVLDAADLVTAHSAYLETRLRPLLHAGTPVARIGWGVDLTAFRPGLDVGPLRRRWEIGEQDRVIFSPRLAQAFYNHERVIRALPAVLKQISRAVLVLRDHCSETRYVETLRRLAAESGVADRVRFLGTVPYDTLPLWYNLADAVVMVPMSDGMPNSLLEAMACGAVPVLNRLPQYEEMIRDGVNGLLVEPEGDDLGDTLVEALSNPGLRARMACSNRALVEDRADQDQEMGRMERAYRSLAQADGNDPRLTGRRAGRLVG